MENTADEAMAERLPPECLRALNVSGQRGGEGRGRTPTQQRAPMACSKGEEGDPKEAQRGNPLARGATRTGWGPTARAWSAGAQHRRDGNKAPPRTAARA